MIHVFFIDPLEKLNIKKDSSLMMALTFKEQGEKVYFLFENDLFFSNHKLKTLSVYDFDGAFDESGFYLKDLKLADKKDLKLSKDILIHMRIDPPFDTRYLRLCWVLLSLETLKVKITNNPRGIITHNEKLFSYEQSSSIPSFVGGSLEGFKKFIFSQKSSEFILKPLDLYQGIGVEKISKLEPDLNEKFMAKVTTYGGMIVAQPFIKNVEKGEVRALYFKGKELGSILKVPKSGEYLANIAQGASFKPIKLSQKVKKDCDKIAKILKKDGVDFIAFDILDHKINEINITCPGLLVEVSKAHKKNLSLDILAKL